MYGRWEHMKLHDMIAEGLSQTAIAERLGVSRRTVHRWLQAGGGEFLAKNVRYGPRPPAARKIDEYRDIIETRLSQYPRLSAQRLFAEIRAAGYTGGYTQVREFVRSVRTSSEPEDVKRFETEPGEQGQVDFAHVKFPFGRRYALVVVLGYSRLMWIRFVPRQTMSVLTGGLEQAFQWFGGVPRTLLFDQMKTVVNADLRDAGGSLVENVTFMHFAAHYGFRIRACRPYRAQTKGKVERPIRYLRENFIYGREFVSDDDIDARLREWLDETANTRIHGTTGERPQARFERDERHLLLPLPQTPFPRLGEPPTTPQKQRTAPQTVARRDLCEYAALTERTA